MALCSSYKIVSPTSISFIRFTFTQITFALFKLLSDDCKQIPLLVMLSIFSSMAIILLPKTTNSKLLKPPFNHIDMNLIINLY